MPSSPEEAELVAAIKAVRSAHPDLGILKLWAALKTEHPEWTVSEKRFRKGLSSIGGSGAAPASSSGPSGSVAADELVAQTGLDSTLDIPTIAPKVKAKIFGGTKGKGLVARSKLEQGEMLWQEEPWICCPDPGIKRHCEDQVLCTHCLAMWQPPPPTAVKCKDCDKAFFCNRLCMSRASSSGSHHVLLCEGVNPAAGKLNRFMAEREWRSIDVVARIIAKWRGERAWGEEGAAEATQKRVWESIARLNIRTREEGKADWPKRSTATESQWREGHSLIVSALNPTSGTEAKKFNAALQSRARGRKLDPLTEEETQRWFSYESFLDLIGLVNINMEDSGGLYALHCHMNHCCEPNIQVRNLPRQFASPSDLPAPLPPPNPRGVRGNHKLTMLARRTIHPGDELTVSYVDMNLPRRARRQALRDGYGFWCGCVKCQREEREEERERERLRAERERAKPELEGSKVAEGGEEQGGEKEESNGQAQKEQGKSEKGQKGHADVADLAATLDELTVDDMV